MPIKGTTREEMKRIMNGLSYHCMDLASFMAEHVRDPYFETEEGKRMRKYAMDICANHAMACMEFMMNKMSNEDSDKEPDIKQILKDML